MPLELVLVNLDSLRNFCCMCHQQNSLLNSGVDVMASKSC